MQGRTSNRDCKYICDGNVGLYECGKPEDRNDVRRVKESWWERDADGDLWLSGELDDGRTVHLWFEGQLWRTEQKKRLVLE